MRKAFTLIELMITILITTIFLNFVFRFYSNVLIELRYLEAKDSLAYNAFRASQIIKNGVYSGNIYIGGIVTLNTLIDSNNFEMHDENTTTINTLNKHLIISSSNTNIPSYRLNDIEIENCSLSSEGHGLYMIKFDASKNSIMRYSELNQTSYKSYRRLVYVK